LASAGSTATEGNGKSQVPARELWQVGNAAAFGSALQAVRCGDFERVAIENVDLLSVDFQRRAPARPE